MADSHWALSKPRPVHAHEPDLDPLQWDIIWRALRWAFEEVRRLKPDLFRSGAEEDITAELERALGEMTPEGDCRAPEMALFETPVRSARQETAAGTNLKEPDLTFRPQPAPQGVRFRSRWGAFIECKIVNGTSHPLRNYCTKGVQRFCRGEYCAWMPSGGMLAYVRDGTTPHSSLLPRLTDDVFSTKAQQAGNVSDTSSSSHGRGHLKHPCVDIVITHVWLDAR